MDKDDNRCSFCSKSADDVQILIAGPTENLFICDECVHVCVDVVADDRRAREKAALSEKGSKEGWVHIPCALCGSVGVSTALPHATVRDEKVVCSECVRQIREQTDSGFVSED